MSEEAGDASVPSAGSFLNQDFTVLFQAVALRVVALWSRHAAVVERQAEVGGTVECPRLARV